jgi:hypothetical protein
MPGPCAHTSQRTRDELTAALQARSEESLADEPTDSGDGVGEVDIGPLPDDITVHLDVGYDTQKTRDELAGRGMTRDISHKATSPDPGRAALAC